MGNQVRVGPQYPLLVIRGDSIYETTKAEVLCDKIRPLPTQRPKVCDASPTIMTSPRLKYFKF